MKFLSRVRNQLVASFGGAAAFTILASLLAIYTFIEVRGVVRHIATDRLPLLAEAYQLAHRADALVSAVPAVIGARDTIALKVAINRLNDEVAWLDEVIGRVRERGGDSDLLEQVQRQKSVMAARIGALGAGASRRLELGRRLGALSLELSGQSRRIGQEIRDARRAGRLDDRLAGRLEEEHHRALVLTLTLAAASDPIQAGRLVDAADRDRAAFGAFVEAEAAGSSLAALTLELDDRLSEMAALHRDDLDARDDVEVSMILQKQAAGKLVTAVSQIVTGTLSDITEAGTALKEQLDIKTILLIALSVVCVFSVALIARRIARGIGGRLEALQRSMHTIAVGDRSAVIPFDGRDEIADMARALGMFVRDLNRSEDDLRAAKERAELAFEEMKRAQASLVQAEKLASLGGLVAGIAHEINTPAGNGLLAASHLEEQTQYLAGVIADGQLRRSILTSYLTEAAEASKLILASLRRVSELVGSFKQVAVDRASEARRTFVLCAFLDDVLTSLQPSFKGLPYAVTVVCSDDLMIDGYPGALSQVITNLVMNSIIHGFGHGLGGEGSETGRAGRITLTAVPAGDDAITLEVADDGQGIAPEHLSQIFDPFFTTRRSTGGSGLGLHIVHNIVVGTLGGRITVTSPVGGGARFILYLPRVSPAV